MESSDFVLASLIVICEGLTNAPAHFEQRVAAEAILRKIQEHPDSWQKVDQILKESANSQTKFFALQVRSVKASCFLLSIF